MPHDLRPELPDLGHLVGVWAHPDDEAYLSAGVMAAATDAGCRVACVTATLGELGFPDDDLRSPAERAALRDAELSAALAAVGVADRRLLGYPDGAWDQVDDTEVIGRLVAILDEVRPDTVLTFPPDGGTYHPDHIAVSRWATRAVAAASTPPRLLYATTTPEWNAVISALVDPAAVMMADRPMPSDPLEEMAEYTSLPDDLARRKVAALRCHASQVEPLVAMAGEEAFFDLARWEFFRAPRASDWPG